MDKQVSGMVAQLLPSGALCLDLDVLPCAYNRSDCAFPIAVEMAGDSGSKSAASFSNAVDEVLRAGQPQR